MSNVLSCAKCVNNAEETRIFKLTRLFLYICMWKFYTNVATAWKLRQLSKKCSCIVTGLIGSRLPDTPIHLTTVLSTKIKFWKRYYCRNGSVLSCSMLFSCCSSVSYCFVERVFACKTNQWPCYLPTVPSFSAMKSARLEMPCCQQCLTCQVCYCHTRPQSVFRCFI